MELTLTAKIKIVPLLEQHDVLHRTVRAYREGCQFVSALIFASKQLGLAALHSLTYRPLREQFTLRSQMAQSVVKTVVAKYKGLKKSGHKWTKVEFRKPELDLVWNRDYSLVQGVFSVNTLAGRIRIPYESKGMEHFLDGSWKFGTAKLVYKHGKFFLHIPMTKDIPAEPLEAVKQVVGIDLGVNFLLTAYDSQGRTVFVNGRKVKDRRSHYKQLRRELQQRKTPSARRRLREIGQRETRWMTAVNHQVSKALVERYTAPVLFVLEDLTGVRGATEKVRKSHRYETVSWAFYQLRQMIEYKAAMKKSSVIALDPEYTSQTCPKCGHVEKANRDKKRHQFECRNCHYRSNDDRIGAMNLHRKGMKYLVAVTTRA